MNEPDSNFYLYDEAFRDTIGTVDGSGKRIWLSPKKPAGSLHNRRIVVTIVLLTLFFSGPLIKLNGRPFFLFNIFERRFVIFGQVFWPQDFVLLAVCLLTFFVFIILFTIVFGRIWCGWMCPQTLFLEMVFRKIEFWIEGDGAAQRKLKAAPLSADKIGRNLLKHGLFILLSIIIAHTALAYLIGSEETLKIIQHAPSQNLTGFIGLSSFAILFYLVFAKFREQACIVVCPYGRLQGVLLVRDSILVAYDWVRGEPRAKRKREVKEASVNGDCIDCKLCVHVCPTGIDIRNGTQLECVNCTACIDACDDVMIKLQRPPGLIRYASYNSIKNGVSRIMTPRVIACSFVLSGLLGLLIFGLVTRTDVETNVFKVAGTLFQRDGQGGITNLYNAEFVNKTFDSVRVTVKVETPAGASLIKPDRLPIVVPAGKIIKAVYFIRIPSEAIHKAKTDIVLGVYQNGRQIDRLKVKFIGPVAF